MKTPDEIEDEREILADLDREDDYWAACWEAAQELERHRAKGWSVH